MERCPNCGNKLSSIDVLCPKCGAVVEVIQTKSNTVSPETVTESNIKKPEPAQKKDIPKYFNVYYEGLPDEDSIDNESEEAQHEAQDQEPEKSVPSGQADFIEQPKSFQAPIEEAEPENDKAENGAFSEIVTAKVNEGDDNDYSPRYLENLKNLDLPEIDDISNFDPEEYMREYKYKKILSGQTVADDSQTDKKQWLEIEETETQSDLASELTKVREDVQQQAEQPVIAERRYRGTQDSRTEKRRDSRPEKRRDDSPEKRRDDSPEKERESAGENMQAPSKKTRRPRAAAMVLFWALITVAILFSCIFFDNYVKSSYDSYGDFIKTITNGQVVIDSENP